MDKCLLTRAYSGYAEVTVREGGGSSRISRGLLLQEDGAAHSGKLYGKSRILVKDDERDGMGDIKQERSGRVKNCTTCLKCRLLGVVYTEQSLQTLTLG